MKITKKNNSKDDKQEVGFSVMKNLLRKKTDKQVIIESQISKKINKTK